jgi:hypothetical protein
VAIVHVPAEFPNALSCLMQSQFFAAASNLAAEGDLIKVKLTQSGVVANEQISTKPLTIWFPQLRE